MLYPLPRAALCRSGPHFVCSTSGPERSADQRCMGEERKLVVNGAPLVSTAGRQVDPSFYPIPDSRKNDSADSSVCNTDADFCP